MSGRPRSIVEAAARRNVAAAAQRLVMPRDECQALAKRIFAMARGPGETRVDIESTWLGDLRWARNRTSLAGDHRHLSVTITRTHRGQTGVTETNQLRDDILQGAVRAAERFMQFGGSSAPDIERPRPEFEYASPDIWGEASVALGTAERAEVARQAIAPAERAGMLSAGYLAVKAIGIGYFDTRGMDLYYPYTSAECAMTVRDPAGTGSGWAGLSSYDWSRIDAAVLAERALEKCLTSRNPVALEPGRYTVVLEPQAVGDLVRHIVYLGTLQRIKAEQMRGPFALKPGFSKLGMKVADERVTIGHDPNDPEIAVVPFTQAGEPLRPVTWIDRGVLRTLAYERDYALKMLNEPLGQPVCEAYRMSGGTTSVEDMIRTTRRGLLVTRFSNWNGLDVTSGLGSGLTRDGLWLIENGKISKPVKNLRFTESPLFVLNSIDALGEPVPVFRPGVPMIVPPLKARDFSFTSLVDAV